MPFATTLMAIVGAAQFATSIGAGIKSAKDTRSANEEARADAKMIHKEKLQQQAFQNKQTMAALSLSKKAQRFNESEAEANRVERIEERGYNRLQNAANKKAEYLNNKAALTASRLSPMFSRGK